MSIFGIDWDGDGEIGDMDLVTDLFIIDELEKEEKSKDFDFESEDNSDFDIF